MKFDNIFEAVLEKEYEKLNEQQLNENILDTLRYTFRRISMAFSGADTDEKALAALEHQRREIYRAALATDMEHRSKAQDVMIDSLLFDDVPRDYALEYLDKERLIQHADWGASSLVFGGAIATVVFALGAISVFIGMRGPEQLLRDYKKAVKERDKILLEFASSYKNVDDLGSEDYREISRMQREIEKLNKQIEKDGEKIYRMFDQNKGNFRNVLKSSSFNALDEMMDDIKNGNVISLSPREIERLR